MVTVEQLTKAATQERFLKLAYEYFHEKQYQKPFSDITYLDRHNMEYYGLYANVGPEVIRWLYKFGRDYQVLEMDFHQFELLLKNKLTGWHCGGKTVRYYSRYRRRTWWGYGNFPAEEYRVRKGFTNCGHKKKDKLETPQQAWRRKKKFAKDKNPARRWHGNWKKNLKHFNSRKHRQKERYWLSIQNVDKLRWDELDLPGKKSYKRAENRWSWD